MMGNSGFVPGSADDVDPSVTVYSPASPFQDHSCGIKEVMGSVNMRLKRRGSQSNWVADKH